MERWERIVSTIGAGRCILVLGGLYVAVGVLLTTTLLLAGAGPAEVVGRFALLTAPGVVLAYGGHRMSEMDLHPTVYPRIAAWTFGGFGVMAVIVAVMEFSSPSGIDNPSFAAPLATALGSIGGFGAGIHDGRAKTRERELKATVEQLRASNERLEQFAYAASHDLQEPLRMVSSYLQLLESRYADDLDEDAREFIDFAVDGADRMRAMVDSLLEYSQVTRDESPFEPTAVGAVFESARGDLRLRIEETDATVTSDDLPTVTADPDQLLLVFQNLLSNALKYSGDEPPRVHVSADRVDGEWQFSVADEGVGIDLEYHDRVFTVFEQLHTSEEASEKGSAGVGLALCERIVEHHGGEIWIESAPGEGTTVYFTIPVGEERQSTSTDVSPTQG